MGESLLDGYRAIDHEPSKAEPSIIYGDGRTPRLELRERDGSSRSLLYKSLRYLAFKQADGSLLLVFDECAVELRGKNLLRLYQALNEHRIKTILVVSAGEPAGPSDSVLVESCTVTPREGSESSG